jgi:hypothetical protein
LKKSFIIKKKKEYMRRKKEIKRIVKKIVNKKLREGKKLLDR